MCCICLRMCMYLYIFTQYKWIQQPPNQTKQFIFQVCVYFSFRKCFSFHFHSPFPLLFLLPRPDFVFIFFFVFFFAIHCCCRCCWLFKSSFADEEQHACRSCRRRKWSNAAIKEQVDMVVARNKTKRKRNYIVVSYKLLKNDTSFFFFACSSSAALISRIQFYNNLIILHIMPVVATRECFSWAIKQWQKGERKLPRMKVDVENAWNRRC